MANRIITFPVTGGSKPPASSSPFIKPVLIVGGHNIGLPIPYDIVDVGTLLALQEQLNRTAVPAADKHLTVAALDSVVSAPFGRVKCPALLANAIVWNNYWFFWCLWGAGRIHAINNLTINDAPPGSGGFNNHLGAATQAIDGSLFISMSSVYRLRTGDPTLTFDQTCPGIAYSVVTAPLADIEQQPQINAILDGLVVYDPRDGTQDPDDDATWKFVRVGPPIEPGRNSALVLANFVRSSRYGANRPVNWTSVENAADIADDAGRTCDILIDRSTPISDWLATLQQSANCWLDTSGPEVKLVPDAETISVATFTHANGEILSVDGEEGEDLNQLPTVGEVVYTNTADATWRDESAPLVKVPGVDTGLLPWRKEQVRMPWIQTEALATRENYLRLNKKRLRLPKFNVAVLDEGLIPEVGDAITLDYPDSGYVNLKAKVASARPTPQGWILGVFYDDPGAYRDDIIATPTPPTPNPNPFFVPPVTNLVGIEDPIETRILATWSPPAGYPYIKDYVVDVTQSATPIDSGKPRVPSFRSIIVTPALDYVVTVRVRSIFGMLSTPVSVTVHVNALTYVAFRYAFTTPVLVNMVRLYDWGTGQYFWVTNMGDLWNPTFPSNFNTYTNPIFTYHTPGTSTLTTEVADATQTYAGDWAGGVTRVDINGTGAQYIELATASPSPRTRHAGTAYTGSGRYAALSSEATGTGTQRVNALGEISVTVTR